VSFMGDIRGAIKDDVEDEFRRLAMRKFGYRRGSLSHALEEALSEWIEENRAKEKIKV
jgi:hypothetical protein